MTRYEHSRASLRFVYKGVQYHPGILLALLSQIACLVVLAFAPESMEHYKWLASLLGFSLLFGLIRSLGLYGTWYQFRDEVSPEVFFGTNVVDFAIAAATAGELVTLVLMR